MATTMEIGMSVDEFLQRYDEAPFELVDGEFIPMSPNIPRSSRISGKLFRLLSDHADSHNLGEVFIETPFVLKASKQWVKGSRVPDVMFIRAERLKELAASDAEWETSPLPLVPDLAVEVMSPTDRFAALSQKARRYLSDGVQQVWVVDPERRAVFVYVSDSIIPLSEEDKLSAEAVIPGFALEIIKLFE